METPQLFPNPDSLLELHQFLRQLVSVDEAAIRGEPDFARVEAYWHIGRIIVETEQQGQDRADYGVQLIEGLSRELTHHYGKGYKTSNLWWFRQFYMAFPILHAVRGEFSNLRQHLRTELTWTHYRLLLAIDNQQERHFYLHNAADEGWSYRTLNRLIKSRYYYQVALGEDQLLTTTLAPKKVTKTGTQRSRVAQARQTLLNQLGWALVSRVASELPMSVLKPDVLFFHYRLHRFVGLWVSEATPALSEQIRYQLTEWEQHQPAETSSFPLALLLRGNNEIHLIMTSATPPLSDFETSLLPKSL
ncbi:DUF1016 family protein [Rudanella paleaurantiibacter]|uniref:DUF1016 family protein n=1 Tax=Rudanella paleaurantiibacter TaxID=2614655 RepID=A0A7J5TSZ0_9BACT|nr:DUF1016 N-terminal domain-containing protein [Rudanella paleaurantiibacter]KAB7726647.1 DUF1016 family protein [Rudanella paleaurantiibacter]